LARFCAEDKFTDWHREDKKISKIPETWPLLGPDHIPYRLVLLSRFIDRQTSRQLRESTGLTAAEWRVLAHIVVLGESNSSRIADAAASDAAEVSRAAKELERKGLITRRKNPENRTKLILAITKKGQALYDRARSSRLEYFQWLLQDLDSAEKAALDAALLKLVQRVDIS
tara:strand:+ start:61 stop:573 length:513 start_codon:yes stop_codon:yes gene_type:complete